MSQIGDTNQVGITGQIAYGFDGTDARPLLVDSAGRLILATDLTTYTTRTAGTITVAGTAWTTLLAVAATAMSKAEEIWAYTVTKAGAWAGNAKLRILAGTAKVYPFGAEDVEGTDFVDTVAKVLPRSVDIPAASAYTIQFRSSEAADGAGETLALTELDVIQRG